MTNYLNLYNLIRMDNTAMDRDDKHRDVEIHLKNLLES